MIVGNTSVQRKAKQKYVDAATSPMPTYYSMEDLFEDVLVRPLLQTKCLYLVMNFLNNLNSEPRLVIKPDEQIGQR